MTESTFNVFVLPFDGFSAEFIPVDFSTTRMSENGAERRPADVLRHPDHVDERRLAQPVGCSACQRTHNVFTVPERDKSYKIKQWVHFKWLLVHTYF
jgi:hypothetical protein